MRFAVVTLALTGIALRVLATHAFEPAHLTHASFGDAQQLVDAANRNVFIEPTRSSGYPMFLKVVGELGGGITATVTVQHLLGMLTAVLLFLAVRHLGASVWLALVPAAVVALNGDQLFLEHTLLTDALFTTTIAAALYAAVRCLDGGRARWLVTLGLLLAAATLVRTIGLMLIPLALLWLLFALDAPWRRRVILVTLVAATAVAPLLAEGFARAASTDYPPFSTSNSRSLYARIGQFADCNAFKPPPGTQRLCEKKAFDERPGPTAYNTDWRLSPAWREFGAPPKGDTETRAFARAAVLHQPVSYINAVAEDLWRYVDTDLPRRKSSGLNVDALLFVDRLPKSNRRVERGLEPFYGPVQRKVRATASALRDYQAVMRVHGPLLLTLVLLSVPGVILGPRRHRVGVALFSGMAIALLVIPVALLTYNPRYGIPAMGPLAASATLGASSLVELVRARRSGRAPTLGVSDLVD